MTASQNKPQAVRGKQQAKQLIPDKKKNQRETEGGAEEVQEKVRLLLVLKLTSLLAVWSPILLTCKLGL